MSEERKQVLLADDETDMHEFVRAALEDEVDLICVSDGEEALRMVREEKPDLVILDVQMPKKDGFVVFAEMRKDESTRSIPVIMLTGVGERTGLQFDASDMDEFLGAKPEAFIDKPVDPDILLETVKKILAR